MSGAKCRQCRGRVERWGSDPRYGRCVECGELARLTFGGRASGSPRRAGAPSSQSRSQGASLWDGVAPAPMPLWGDPVRSP